MRGALLPSSHAPLRQLSHSHAAVSNTENEAQLPHCEHALVLIGCHSYHGQLV